MAPFRQISKLLFSVISMGLLVDWWLFRSFRDTMLSSFSAIKATMDTTKRSGIVVDSAFVMAEVKNMSTLATKSFQPNVSDHLRQPTGNDVIPLDAEAPNNSKTRSGLVSDNATVSTLATRNNINATLQPTHPTEPPVHYPPVVTEPKTIPPNHDSNRTFYEPRVLIGIVSDSQTFASRLLRDRHRKVYRLWNDTRLCSLKEFVAMQRDEQHQPFVQSGSQYYDTTYPCQVIYTFVLGAYSSNTSSPFFADDIQGIPTIRLYDSPPQQPLVLDHVPTSSNFTNTSMLPYGDILDHEDGTFLNIVESMENGKSATFVFWASQTCQRYKIPFIAKVDGDSFVSLSDFLPFLHQQLPKMPFTTVSDTGLIKSPSVIAGSPLLRKHWKNAGFLASTDESFWEREYYAGSHLYYNGGLYLMSHDLAASATLAARKLEAVFPRIMNHHIRSAKKLKRQEEQPHGYLEGIEDHDTISTAEYGHYTISPHGSSTRPGNTVPSIIQWVYIPKKLVFHLHPVKIENDFDTFYNKERNIKSRRDKAEPLALYIAVPSPTKPRTLLVIHQADSKDERRRYKQSLSEQGYRICNGRDSPNLDCDIHYLFVRGLRNITFDGPQTEKIHNMSTLVASSSFIASNENDLLELNVNGSDPSQLALSTLYYLQEQFDYNARATTFDLIMFCKASHMINIAQWESNVLSTAQMSLGQQQHLLIGDTRDKFRQPSEFHPDCPGRYNKKSGFGKHQAGVQLYLADDVFALSANLIPHLLDAARQTKEGDRCDVGHMGHDLTSLVYIANVVMQWMRIPNSLQFWYKLD